MRNKFLPFPEESSPLFSSPYTSYLPQIMVVVTSLPNTHTILPSLMTLCMSVQSNFPFFSAKIAAESFNPSNCTHTTERLHFWRALTSVDQARSDTAISLRFKVSKVGKFGNISASATMALLPDRFRTINLGQRWRSSHISCVNRRLQQLRSSSSMFPLWDRARTILFALDAAQVFDALLRCCMLIHCWSDVRFSDTSW